MFNEYEKVRIGSVNKNIRFEYGPNEDIKIVIDYAQ